MNHSSYVASDSAGSSAQLPDLPGGLERHVLVASWRMVQVRQVVPLVRADRPEQVCHK